MILNEVTWIDVVWSFNNSFISMLILGMPLVEIFGPRASSVFFNSLTSEARGKTSKKFSSRARLARNNTIFSNQKEKQKMLNKRNFCVNNIIYLFLFYIPFLTKGFLINKGNLEKNTQKTLSRIYIIENKNIERWTCSKFNSHKYIKRLKFWFFRQITRWGIQGSIIKSEESWINFVLPLPHLNEFDSIHFLKNFGSKIISTKIYIRHIIVVDLCQTLLYRWLERNWSTSIEDMKNDQVEAKIENHFRVTGVGRNPR